MRDYRGLEVWEKAHRLTVEIYRATDHFPKSEQFGLTSQIRRSSAAVPTNIAEGCGRRSQAEFAQFLHVAIGSVNELAGRGGERIGTWPSTTSVRNSGSAGCGKRGAGGE